MNALSVYITRIFIGGLICFGAMLFSSGSGARREVIRLCCGCLMIILFLTPVGDFSLNLSVLEDLKGSAEEIITGSTEEFQKENYRAIASQLCVYVEEQAEKKGIICDANLTYLIEEGNIMRIKDVSIKGALTDAQKETICDIVEQEIGGHRESVVFMGDVK